MTDGRWTRLNRVVDDALQRPATEREAFVRSACGGDVSLCHDALSLLREAGPAERFLEQPPYATDVSIGPTLRAGMRLGPYRIDAPIGAGGMGEVYRATDPKLRRTVAIKVLAHGALTSAEQRARFVREARAASALNHPHIVAIYDINLEAGRDFIAMEFIPGAPLQQLIPARGLPVECALDLVMQVVRAMAAAHANGLVHRDLKPANLLVTPEGHVKVIDFGLAQLTRQSMSASTTLSGPTPDNAAIGGTPGYAAPEQVEGKVVDARADVFAIGAVLYEMLTGRRAFDGTSTAAALAAVLHDTPVRIAKLRRDVSRDLEALVTRCLDKDPDTRYPSATELLADLQRIQAVIAARRIQLSLVFRRPAVTFSITGLLLVLAVYGTWSWQRQSRIRWAREVALPEARRLRDLQEFDPAFRLIMQAQQILPEDDSVRDLVRAVAPTPPIETTPSGAEVCVKGYRRPDAEWLCLGRSPISNVRMPAGFLRWRITLAGYSTLEAAFEPNVRERLRFQLKPLTEAPEGMVFIPASTKLVSFFRNSAVFDDFWIDRYEVSNREFKKFVDGGGYERAEFWSQGVTKEMIATFLDTTHRPGPANWEAGTYRTGEADYPVTGVSWYEASAYAVFAGKALPTVYEWSWASGNSHDFSRQDQIARESNFSPAGLVSRGRLAGLSTFGAFDMAGNAREWVLNQTQSGNRYALGGAWDEPTYVFSVTADAAPAPARDIKTGFRCVKRFNAPSAEQSAAINVRFRDFATLVPAGDREFESYRAIYAYDARRPLNAKAEPPDDSAEDWRDQTLSFDNADATDRVPVHIFLPKHGTPPFQAIVFFPGDGAVWNGRGQGLDYLLKSGRAVVFPFLRGYYNRGGRIGVDVKMSSDLVREWYQDLSRTLDYLETRKSDIDSTRTAYMGLSRGGMFGPVFTALDPRFKASVLIGGGFDLIAEWKREIDPFNFVPHVTTPTLMVHGLYDPSRPMEISARLMFEALKAPKKLAPSKSGHVPLRADTIAAALAWFDLYLGKER